MGNFLKKLFGSSNDAEIKRLLDKVNALEAEIHALSDEELQAKTPAFKQRLANGETLDALLPEAFAVVREAAQRSALRVVRQIRRDAAIHTSVTEHGEHDLTVRMEMEQVFAIEMAVVSHEQATMLERTFKANAEAIYQKLLGVMTQEYPD